MGSILFSSESCFTVTNSYILNDGFFTYVECGTELLSQKSHVLVRLYKVVALVKLVVSVVIQKSYENIR